MKPSWRKKSLIKRTNSVIKLFFLNFKVFIVKNVRRIEILVHARSSNNLVHVSLSSIDSSNSNTVGLPIFGVFLAYLLLCMLNDFLPEISNFKRV